METFPKSKSNAKMETKEAQEIYKIRSKTAELPFANIKQNMHLTEFNNKVETSKYRIQIIHNWTQLKKNIQRNKQ